MARKKSRFQSIRDDQEGTPRDIPLRPDRVGARREARELSVLANRLCKLPVDRVEALPIEGLLVDELATLRRSAADAGGRRQLRRVVRLLREADLDAIQAELDGHGVHDTRMRSLERWRSRIIAEGDSAIQEFMDTHDGVDRGQLRTLARQASADAAASSAVPDPDNEAVSSASKATKRLFQALKEAVEKPAVDDASDDSADL